MFFLIQSSHFLVGSWIVCLFIWPKRNWVCGFFSTNPTFFVICRLDSAWVGYHTGSLDRGGVFLLEPVRTEETWVNVRDFWSRVKFRCRRIDRCKEDHFVSPNLILVEIYTLSVFYLKPWTTNTWYFGNGTARVEMKDGFNDSSSFHSCRSST